MDFPQSVIYPMNDSASDNDRISVNDRLLINSNYMESSTSECIFVDPNAEMLKPTAEEEVKFFFHHANFW